MNIELPTYTIIIGLAVSVVGFGALGIWHVIATDRNQRRKDLGRWVHIYEHLRKLRASDHAIYQALHDYCEKAPPDFRLRLEGVHHLISLIPRNFQGLAMTNLTRFIDYTFNNCDDCCGGGPYCRECGTCACDGLGCKCEEELKQPLIHEKSSHYVSYANEGDYY